MQLSSIARRLLQRFAPKTTRLRTPVRRPARLLVDHLELESRDLPTGTPAWAVGAAPGGEPRVWVYDSAGVEVSSYLAYESTFTGGVRVAVADLNADGTLDVVTGAGPGGGPRVRAFDGKTGTGFTDFMAYDTTFVGGVWVAAGPVGSGQFGIATGADAGGGPHVRVFSSSGTQLQNLFAFDTSFTGGVRVALGQKSSGSVVYATPGDGLDPTVRGFAVSTGSQVFEQEAGPTGTTGGTLVAAGDLNADGADDIFTAVTSGGGTELRVYSGADGMYMHQSRVESWADGLGVVNWNGQRAVGLHGYGSTQVYVLASGTETTFLGQLDGSQWGGAGSAVGGSPAGGSAGSLGAGSKETLTTTWPIGGMSVTVTSTVTKGIVGYPDKYQWEYHLHNNDFVVPDSSPYQGIGIFTVASDVSDAATNMWNSEGWDQYVGNLFLDPTLISWQAQHGGVIGVLPGDDADFKFVTPATAIVAGVGHAYDASVAMEGFGPALVPAVQIKEVTWKPKEGATGAEFGEQPKGTPGGGLRAFPEKKKHTDTTVAEFVDVRVVLSVPKAGVQVKLYSYDVDDPTPEDIWIIDDENAATDNRNASGIGGLNSVTNAQGVAIFTVKASPRPGDNYRAVATVDGSLDLATKIQARQKDGTKAGVYYTDTGAAVASSDGVTVKSPLLTVWRRLHIERDHMRKPDPANQPAAEIGTFGGDTDDPEPTADIANPGIGWLTSRMRTGEYRKGAYIEVTDDLDAVNAKKTIKFVHNLVINDAKALLATGRDVPTSDSYWAVQVVGAYEAEPDQDFDPNNFDDARTYGFQPGPGAVAIFTEVIRDEQAFDPRTATVEVIIERIVLHEVLHSFGLVHTIPPGKGDEGPMNSNNNLLGGDFNNSITENQIVVLRTRTNPNHSL